MNYKPCLHGERRIYCRKCKALGIGGDGLCEHGIRKTECKDCGGNRICEHNKMRRDCRECGGASICEHNKHRKTCLLCNPINVYKIAAKSAKTRKIPFLLTFDEYLVITAEPCFYCGENERPRGVDRFNNDHAVGYTLENSRSCCAVCNMAKRTLGSVEFTEWILKAADHIRSVEQQDAQEAYEKESSGSTSGK
jgi:hypothetical protein